MGQLSKTASIANLSFGRADHPPIEVNWVSRIPGLKIDIPLGFKIYNNQGLFEAETQLSEYHSTNNKQTSGYNPNAAATTGAIEVFYPDHSNDETVPINEFTSHLFHRQLSNLLSFFQRRRIVFGGLRLMAYLNPL